jgi:hypothetical protein
MTLERPIIILLVKPHILFMTVSHELILVIDMAHSKSCTLSLLGDCNCPMMNQEELVEHKQSHTKQNSWWLKDVKGIEVSRVCDHCIAAVKAQYKPEIFGEGDESYEDVVEEPIEED